MLMKGVGGAKEHTTGPHPTPDLENWYRSTTFSFPLYEVFISEKMVQTNAEQPSISFCKIISKNLRRLNWGPASSVLPQRRNTIPFRKRFSQIITLVSQQLFLHNFLDRTPQWTFHITRIWCRWSILLCMLPSLSYFSAAIEFIPHNFVTFCGKILFLLDGFSCWIHGFAACNLERIPFIHRILRNA